ncbi:MULTISPECIES: type II toxin-antitoxin system death-on-curing family toxin [Lactiplantibacillus]|uniref:Type II toxin-antitoxin system death-on-curing family toxin n=1 Tax=Lactiplantibacillus pentosus TaxID=1589 RepID=A0AB37BEM5_LACPE|nr:MULTISPECIES: type II toxin-antitoxin system death-on-curing family toxin [Lactiplantibacillus]ASG80014.1 type II toxin-antitoxin system death-on-curing family toxin [Lactiplantibacillus pentosus]MCC3162898.1 type II toxin-antitoxin system death-on-curing family toxin [Lactiplantibacillus pentosus]MCJ8188071.1 type II toxin-antitoxin system death-on-curing family toxin [Lactiplantibacillus pentosus]MCM8609219.1 type II toxin-antitoxin system death-on-curing family toxin [Lactiplantibacillus 
MRYLNKQFLIDLNQDIIKRADKKYGGVQYSQGLEIVIEQPQQVLFGKELYPNIWIKAAFMIQKITKKHIFVDGNKRTAFFSGIIFLYANGIRLSYTDDEAVVLILDVTTNPDTDEVMVALAEWLKAHQVPNEA